MSTFRNAAMEEVVAEVRPVDTVGIPLGPGHPVGFLHALGERDDWDDLTVSGALLTDLYQLFTNPQVRFLSGFFGPIERGYRDAGHRIEFVPADFRRFAPILESLCPRVMATAVAPPDESGWMSLSLHAGASVDELHRAGADPNRVLIAEASPNFPRTLGLGPYSHRLHVDECDFVVETDRAPIALDEAEPTDVDRAIAGFATQFIDDGSTLQTGIGTIPSTIATLLAEADGGDYGVHSEMFTSGLMLLHEAGKVTNRAKSVFEGYSITTFAAGSERLYEWLDEHDLVRFLPVDVVNSPEVIANNHNMVSINGAMSVDLFGQVVADTITGRQFSGIGGHEDFVSGSGLDLSDRSLICMPATAMVKGVLHSRLTAELPAGAVVTTPRHQLDVLCTEFGAAELQGKTVRERAMALVEVAHPDFRDELAEAADSMGRMR
ncbi:MAG: acetyl-CoA hydrolase/transferase C-terminal domain-containing protein [Microthrixaceae bacterium]